MAETEIIFVCCPVLYIMLTMLTYVCRDTGDHVVAGDCLTIRTLSRLPPHLHHSSSSLSFTSQLEAEIEGEMEGILLLLYVTSSNGMSSGVYTQFPTVRVSMAGMTVSDVVHPQSSQLGELSLS